MTQIAWELMQEGYDKGYDKAASYFAEKLLKKGTEILFSCPTLRL